jgi:6-phosphogluconolactonase
MFCKTCVILLMIVAVTVSCKRQPSGSSPALEALDTASALVYVGSYTETESSAAGKATGISICSMDLSTGRLTRIGTSPEITNPSYVSVHPSGKWLYAVSETGGKNEPGGSLHAFRLTRAGRSLEFINAVSSRGDYPCYVAVDKTGNFVLAANYGQGNVALFPIREDGGLDEAVSEDQHTGKGPTPRQESPHAHMIVVSHNNHFAYSCDLGTDRIYIYRLDITAGKLIPGRNPYETQAGAGPRHIAFHPSRNLAYVVNELNGTIECMIVDTNQGSLSRFQVISTLPENNNQNAACADIHITPSGRYLYASNRGSHNSLAMYAVDDQTGRLALLGHQPVRGSIPRSFVIDPSGTFLLVANQDTDNIVTFRIDPASGKLIDTGMEIQIAKPVCLKFLK